MSLEEILRKRPDLREHFANMPPGIRRAMKPKPFVAPVPISEKLAAAAKANPESVSVRINARGEDGVVVVDPPQRGEIVEEYVEETAERKARYAAAKAERERMNEEAKQYRPGAGVIHVYDPIKELQLGHERE
jgi:hypothetical protein